MLQCIYSICYNVYTVFVTMYTQYIWQGCQVIYSVCMRFWPTLSIIADLFCNWILEKSFFRARISLGGAPIHN